MIHKSNGNRLSLFGSYYQNSLDTASSQLIMHRQLPHTKSIDCLFSYPCEIRIELTHGIASLLIGDYGHPDDLNIIPIHHYIQLNPNTCFNLIVHSNDAVCKLITQDIKPSAVKLTAPYLYQPFYSPFNVLEIFDCYVTGASQFHFHAASHDYYELFYMLEGSMTLTLADTTFTLTTDDLIVCGPHQPSPRLLASNTHCKYLTVVFDMGNTDKLHFLGHIFSAPGSMASALHNLIHQSESESCYAETFMLCYLQEVITQLIQLSDALLKPHKSPILKQTFQEDLLQQILSYMNQKVAEPMTVEDICHKFFISRSSLQTLFKTHLLTSPKSHLINIKLQKSKELIQENRHTLSEIAYLLGFSSIHYFSRLFKKYFNLSPSEYAKQLHATGNTAD